MKIKIEPFLMKKGNRVAKAAIEFEEADSFLAGFHLVGFTICDDAEKGLFILFPSSIVKKNEDSKPFFFLRPSKDNQIGDLETMILDQYESMVAFNKPRKSQHSESQASTSN
jgi:hypothetical protein